MIDFKQYEKYRDWNGQADSDAMMLVISELVHALSYQTVCCMRSELHHCNLRRAALVAKVLKSAEPWLP